MKEVRIKAKDSMILENKFYVIKKGKILVENIFPNGKVIANEHWLRTGEFVGDLLSYYHMKKIEVPDIELEIKALEDTVLQEVDFDIEDIKNNKFMDKLLLSLMKIHIFQLLYHFYDTKGYILTLLKLYSDSNNVISKDEFNVEHFNISKSQYYNVFSKLKDKGYVKEEKKKIFLNVDKADEYLEGFY